jgi:ABC-type nitrate/sulfonate/bicarbonate transport system substrate-binding protein
LNLTYRKRLATVAVCAMVAAIALVLASNPAARSAPRAEGKTLTVGLQNPYSIFPAFMAQHYGLLKKSGITEIKYTTFTSLPALFAAIQQGQIDIAFQTVPATIAFNRATNGTKLVLLDAGLYSGFSWVAKNGSTIPVATSKDWQTTVKAWKGKKVGVTALGGIIDLETRYLAKQAGLEAGSDYSIVPIGAGAAAVAALKNGVVDVAAGEQFAVSQMEAEQAGRVILSLAKGQGPSALTDQRVLTGALYLTSRATLDAKKDELVAFTKAFRRAKELMTKPSQKSTVVKQMVRTLSINQTLANALYVRTTGKTQLTPATWAKTISTFQTLGILSGPVPAYNEIAAGI